MQQALDKAADLHLHTSQVKIPLHRVGLPAQSCADLAASSRPTLLEELLSRCRFERRSGRTARAHRADCFASPRVLSLVCRCTSMRQKLPMRAPHELISLAAQIGARRRMSLSRVSASASVDRENGELRAIFSALYGLPLHSQFMLVPLQENSVLPPSHDKG